MSNHRELLEKRRAMWREYTGNYSILTEYEKSRMKAAIDQYTGQIRGTVVQGVLQEWNQAIEAHKSAGRAIEAAKIRNAQRW
jgi:hypothetical protein